MSHHKTGISWYRCSTRPGVRKCVYAVQPAQGRFFPTNEAIYTVLARHTSLGLKFRECLRYEDGREVLYLTSPTPSPFAQKAAPKLKGRLALFIKSLHRTCPKKRPNYIYERVIPTFKGR